MSYIQDRETVVLTRIAAARKRTQEWRVGSGMQRTAQTSLYREMEELDRLHRASKSVIPNYRERFVKCSTCEKTFHDEASFLAHWRYGLSGAIESVKATSLLQALGFETDEYHSPNQSSPECVYRISLTGSFP